MKAGERVQRVGWTQCGIVLELEATEGQLKALVHWGTDGRGPVTDWVPVDELEPFPHAVAGDS